MQLIAGLGNPGNKYKNTPHNLGFETIDKLTAKLGIEGYKNQFDSEINNYTSNGLKTIILKPGKYMNLSGEPILACAKYFKIPTEKILVICDDLDLKIGTVRFRFSGGHGGHNGLRSIINNLKTKKFLRIRIGIGKPNNKEVNGFVLGKIENEKKKLLLKSINTIINPLMDFINNSTFKSSTFSIC